MTTTRPAPTAGPRTIEAEAVVGSAASLQHRRLFSAPHDFRPFRGTGLFDRIGGQPAVDRLVDTFYARLEADAALRPLFAADLAETRAGHRLFFAEWLGGPARYSERAPAGLRHRHDGLAITKDLADRWLNHFDHALQATVAAPADRRVISIAAHALARLLVTHQVAPAPPTGRKPTPAPGRSNTPDTQPREVAWCGSGARTVKQATDLARRGVIDDLATTLMEAPDLALPTYAAAIMQAAVLAGQVDVVGHLLSHGAGPNHPFYLPVRAVGAAFERVVFVTPLCAARLKRRRAVEAVLLEAGGADDIFTAAFLGDLRSVDQMLAGDGALAQTPDPAVDVLDITPVEHAVAGGQVESLRLLLDRISRPIPSGVRALRGAAGRDSVPMARMLLAHGADASRIGVGRWVLHPELAPLLAARGATVGSDGAWIGASCTGNQGRKDDPDYVRALLRHGAHVNDRRTGPASGVTGPRDVGATALHYAAKAGFVQTIELLLANGADPGAADNTGRTPLDWLDQAAPSVSRATVRKLLVPARTSIG